MSERWARRLADGQRCRVHVYDTVSRRSEVVHVDEQILLEAPNWTASGDLVLNGDGDLWTMPADGSRAPERIPLTGAPELNNDHVLDPDGLRIHLSGNDGALYTAPLAGGRAERVPGTGDAGIRHFLHGVSPDGARLAYIAIDPAAGWGSGTVRTIGVDGSDDRAVTSGAGADDGSEYAPDGAWIYLNTERFSQQPGHAQIARVRPDGSELEQLTFGDRVSWFPHLDPTGARAVFISFPAGTLGHPADLPVRLHLVDLGGADGADGADGWRGEDAIVDLLGGQGTINVNSWAPDGLRFAYVDYPVG